MKNIAKLMCVLCLWVSGTVEANASETDWYVKPIVGLSFMSDLDGTTTGVNDFSGIANIETDTGFTAGIALGYNLTEKWAVELAWEYRTNDAVTRLGNTATFEDGNYASSLIYLNGVYSFDSINNWTPYVGAGLSYAQEIDIDLERDGVEQSYAGDGDIGFQIFAGVDYTLTKALSVQFEARYGSITGITLDAETGAGRFDDMDYQTSTLQASLKYRF